MRRVVHTISQTLSELVVQAVDRAGHAGILETSEPAVPTQNPRFGDYQSNHAFRLGKAMRTNPRQVAEAVVDQLGQHVAIEKAEVAGPGFVNFTLRDDWVADRVREQVIDPHGGILRAVRANDGHRLFQSECGQTNARGTHAFDVDWACH